MIKHKDAIKGGLADKKKPSDFDSKSLKQGQKVELEHTKNKAIAKEIAMDHLTEDPKYYKKLKTIEKNMIEIVPDGKQEIVEGKEPLKKEPKKKNMRNADNALDARWSKLKKGLNNLKSIMNLEEASKDDESEQTPQEQTPQEQTPQEQTPQEQTEVASLTPRPEESEQVSQGQPVEEQTAQEQVGETEQTTQEQSEELNVDEEEQKIIESLKEHGYSDPEISYIVRGHHSPHHDEIKTAKAAAAAAMSDIDIDHSKRIGDLEFKHKVRQMDLEHDHAKRMKELEYKDATTNVSDPDHKKKLSQLELEEKLLEIQRRKKEIELELSFKEKELEQKLKHAEEVNKKKLTSINSKSGE